MKMQRSNLNKIEIVEGLVIEGDEESWKLVKIDREEVSYVDKDFQRWENDVNDDTKVWGKQRWLVEIVPKDRFQSSHRTHRWVHYFIESFSSRTKNAPRLSRKSPEDRKVQLIDRKIDTDDGRYDEEIRSLREDKFVYNCY